MLAVEEAEPSPSVPLACLLQSRAIGRVLLPFGSGAASVGQTDLYLCRARPDAHGISIRDRAGFDRTVGAQTCTHRLEHVDNLSVFRVDVGETAQLELTTRLFGLLLKIKKGEELKNPDFC